ncbi:carbohydrate-binding protein [Jeongeupia naejangsanensis]|uniref:Chitin-binding type-3 domain-containing protein n=1 Tax=Jeongeupia naejangsanensis TaxID=613195 RepID=A0ABS2BNS7_9NEIS|nr:carbohydrate-binding protein [Jeongeupia naejangsanensis]MBM3117070.1 hypothetical protein [Jeongeupia naejangsanensis]
MTRTGKLLVALLMSCTALAASAREWHEGRHYSRGEVVSYHGQRYRALQSHDAARDAGWTPQRAPSLWEPLNGNRNDGRYDDGQYHR